MIGDDPLVQFIESMSREGLEDTLGLYYGTYRARVTNNKDETGRGLIKVVLSDMSHTQEYNEWIPPAFPVGDQHGFFWPPEEGDFVRVAFATGDLSTPRCYFGGFFGKDKVPVEFAYSSDKRPVKRGFVTRMGHSFVFSDEPDNEYIRMTWHKADSGDPAVSNPSKTADREQGEWSYFEFEPDGSFIAANKNGTMIKFDASKPKQALLMIDEHGNSFTMGSKGAKLVDKDGDYVDLTNEKINVVAKKTVNVMGTTINLGAGGVNIGQNAKASPVLEELLKPYLQLIATHIHPVSGAATGPSPALTVVPPISSKSVKLKL